MTGFVLSFENRFGVQYKKTSVKMESLSIEAANFEDDLVHIMKLTEGSSTIGTIYYKWIIDFLLN